jgi:hypothetical protein
MPRPLKELIDLAQKKPMTEKQQEAQRRSFAYGNTHIENDRVTREVVDKAAESIANE